MGGTIENERWIPIKLPENVKKVTSFDSKVLNKLKGDIVPVTIKYSSDNESVAVINHVGRIFAVGEGTSKITATITQKNGTSKDFVIIVKVMKAYIEIVSQSNVINIGEKVPFEVKVYGLRKEDIRWSTSKVKRAMVAMNLGKEKVMVYGKSAGTDYVVIKCGTISKAIKVIVVKK